MPMGLPYIKVILILDSQARETYIPFVLLILVVFEEGLSRANKKCDLHVPDSKSPNTVA